MIKQIVFSIALFIAFAVFLFTVKRLYSFFKLTKPAPIKHIGKRIAEMIMVSGFQTKILRKPYCTHWFSGVLWLSSSEVSK